MTVPELARQNEAAFHHSMKRRCFVHDYKGRSIYLITREVAGRRRLLDRDGQSAGSLHRWSGGSGRQPARITRAECLALNALVAEICGGNAADVVYQSRLGMNPV